MSRGQTIPRAMVEVAQRGLVGANDAARHIDVREGPCCTLERVGGRQNRLASSGSIGNDRCGKRNGGEVENRLKPLSWSNISYPDGPCKPVNSTALFFSGPEVLRDGEAATTQEQVVVGHEIRNRDFCPL